MCSRFNRRRKLGPKINQRVSWGFIMGFYSRVWEWLKRGWRASPVGKHIFMNRYKGKGVGGAGWCMYVHGMCSGEIPSVPVILGNRELGREQSIFLDWARGSQMVRSWGS